MDVFLTNHICKNESNKEVCGLVENLLENLLEGYFFVFHGFIVAIYQIFTIIST